MKVVIIGAGVAGSVLGEFFIEAGHEVLVLEKETIAGGMCKSYHKEGFTYEYGPHILAVHNCSEEAKRYLQTRIDTVETQMTTATQVGGKLTYFPPSLFSAERIGILDQVKKELALRPSKPIEDNFETYLVSKVGPTLYSTFFENFTRKFWGVEPRVLSASWAKTRHLGEDLESKKMFFNKKWCGYPKKDWNELFFNILKKVPVAYQVEVSQVDFEKNLVRTRTGDEIGYDLLISTLHIDQVFDFRFGKLQYAGYRIDPVVLDRPQFTELDQEAISMTYFPESDQPYCRVTDYRTFQKKKHYPYDGRKTIVTYETPDHSIRLYPFTDEKNLALFEQYLKEAARHSNFISFGRMGLYKYLTSDTTVEMALRLREYFKNWKHLDPAARLEAYRSVRGNWSN